MNKYRARKVEIDGEVFDSGAEYEQWLILKERQRLGEISSLERQVVLPLIINGKPVLLKSERYKNGRKCVYTVDFSYVENNVRVYEEKKGNKRSKKGKFGTDTEASRLRRAVAECIYNTEIRVT